VILPFVSLLSLNVAILIIWTIRSPLYFERVEVEKDKYGRVLESRGSCTSKVWIPYMIALGLVNGTAMVLALIQAFHARKIKTEFSESTYIAMAMASIFQALFIGFPVMMLVRSDTTASLFIQTGIVTIISVAILLLIFVPKIRIMRKGITPQTDRRGSAQWTVLTKSGRERSRLQLCDDGSAMLMKENLSSLQGSSYNHTFMQTTTSMMNSGTSLNSNFNSGGSLNRHSGSGASGNSGPSEIEESESSILSPTRVKPTVAFSDFVEYPEEKKGSFVENNDEVQSLDQTTLFTKIIELAQGTWVVDA